MARYNNTTPAGPSPDDSRVGDILGLETTLFIISLLIYFARMYCRVRPRLNLGFDDLFITLAVLFGLGNYVVTILSIQAGYGRHIEFATKTDITKFSRLVFISEPTWVLSLTFVKISVACLLLRIQTTPAWRWGMGFSIFYLVASGIIILSLQFTECRPLRMYWDPTVPGGTCRSPQSVQSGIIGTSVVFIASDFLFSLLPITFIVRIRRSQLERVAIGIIMGLGLLASISGVIKLVGINRWAKTKDPTWDLVPLLNWSHVEEYIAIMAACIPCLKSLCQKIFHNVAVHLSWTKNSQSAFTDIDMMGYKSYPVSSQQQMSDVPASQDREKDLEGLSNHVRQ